MREYDGKINISKDTMLFVVNTVFDEGVKEYISKDEILKKIPYIYERADDIDLIKLLPYNAYIALKSLIRYTETQDDINKFYYEYKCPDIKYLEEAMIIYMKAKKFEYNYFLNPGVIEKLERLFSKENTKIAKKYGKIEKLTKGMLYSYGVVNFKFLKDQICKYMNESISEEELCDIYFKRLNLNTEVNYYDRWNNEKQGSRFVTYLNIDEQEEEIEHIISEQKAKGFQYKNIKEQDILSRQEYLWDKLTQKLYNSIAQKNEDYWEYPFQRTIKENEFGHEILNELIDECDFKTNKEIEKFTNLFLEWYNNSPQYVLGGYTPTEFRKMSTI